MSEINFSTITSNWSNFGKGFGRNISDTAKPLGLITLTGVHTAIERFNASTKAYSEKKYFSATGHALLGIVESLPILGGMIASVDRFVHYAFSPSTTITPSDRQSNVTDRSSGTTTNTAELEAARLKEEETKLAAEKAEQKAKLAAEEAEKLKRALTANKETLANHVSTLEANLANKEDHPITDQTRTEVNTFLVSAKAAQTSNDKDTILAKIDEAEKLIAKMKPESENLRKKRLLSKKIEEFNDCVNLINTLSKQLTSLVELRSPNKPIPKGLLKIISDFMKLKNATNNATAEQILDCCTELETTLEDTLGTLSSNGNALAPSKNPTTWENIGRVMNGTNTQQAEIENLQAILQAYQKQIEDPLNTMKRAKFAINKLETGDGSAQGLKK